MAYAEGNKDEAIKALRAIAQKEEAEGDEPLAIPRAKCWPTCCWI